jgi:hypothetical protein
MAGSSGLQFKPQCCQKKKKKEKRHLSVKIKGCPVCTWHMEWAGLYDHGPQVQIQLRLLFLSCGSTAFAQGPVLGLAVLLQKIVQHPC